FATDTGGTSLTAAASSTLRYAGNAAFNGKTPVQVLLDTVDNLYFLLQADSTTETIFEGHISDVLAGTGPTLQAVYSQSITSDFIPVMQIDPKNHLIYFVNIQGFQAGTNEISVLNRIAYSPTTLAAGTNLTTLGSFNAATVLGNGNGGVVGFG